MSKPADLSVTGLRGDTVSPALAAVKPQAPLARGLVAMSLAEEIQTPSVRPGVSVHT